MPCLGPLPAEEGDKADDEARNEDEPVAGDRVRGGDADLRRQRQFGLFARVFFGDLFEDADEDRDHEGDDGDQDDRGEAEDQQGVHHRRFDLAPERVAFLHLVGDAVEGILQAPGLLPGPDHRPVEAVEDFGMAPHRLLQRAPGLDVGLDAADRLLDAVVLGLLLERAERAQHRHPRGDQGRELTREDRELALVDSFPGLPELLDLERLALLADVEDDQAALAQLVSDLGLRLGLDFAGGRRSGEVERLKEKVVAPATGQPTGVYWG